MNNYITNEVKYLQKNLWEWFWIMIRLRNKVLIEQRNYFIPGDVLEIFTPDKTTIQFKVDKILSEELIELDAARHPLEKLLVSLNIEVPKFSLIRKVNYE